MESLIFGIPALALVIGLTELAKRSGIPSRWCPLVSIFMGVSLMFVANANPYWGVSVVEGLVLGLTASGLYSGTKSVVGQ